MGREAYYTLQEAADILEVSNERVEQMLMHGELEGHREAGRWRIYLPTLNSAEYREPAEDAARSLQGAAGTGVEPLSNTAEHMHQEEGQRESDERGVENPKNAEHPESKTLPVRQERNSAPHRGPLILNRGNQILRTGVRTRLIDLEGLPRSVRVLAILGYVGVIMLLAATLALELFGDQMSGVRFVSSTAEEYIQLPIAAIVVSNLSFVTGWAFILTGASDCRRRVLLPIVLLFVFELFLETFDFWVS